jgi:uncharacterized protein YggE
MLQQRCLFSECRVIVRPAFAFLLAFLFAFPAAAQEQPKPDDTVSFDLSAEEWVTTKTARVMLNAEASVNASSEGSMRADMMKAVNDAAKADWRMTSFNRMLDQTGMERWSVSFEARLPEASLSGLAERLKKASKPGMQLRVGTIDFTPSNEEMEAARAALRTKIFKDAGEQLTSLNTTLPGRSYRISQIVFETDVPAAIPMLRSKRMGGAANEISMASPAYAPEDAQNVNVSTKLVLTAHVVFAAIPPVSR